MQYLQKFKLCFSCLFPSIDLQIADWKQVRSTLVPLLNAQGLAAREFSSAELADDRSFAYYTDVRDHLIKRFGKTVTQVTHELMQCKMYKEGSLGKFLDKFVAIKC